MGLADLHIHTLCSFDGTASASAVLQRAQQIGLNVLAITDHDEIKGALKALELASKFGVEVIPGIEISTAEGHLLALNVTEKIAPNLSLFETLMKVGELGGFCIAPHPMADGLGMSSLDGYAILKAISNPDAARILIGIETYNATLLKKISNHYARILANRLYVAQIGNSDAHVLEAIGLGMTEFEGHTARHLIKALYAGKTHPLMKKEWNSVRILGSWAANYVGSAFTRLANPA